MHRTLSLRDPKMGSLGFGWCSQRAGQLFVETCNFLHLKLQVLPYVVDVRGEVVDCEGQSEDVGQYVVLVPLVKHAVIASAKGAMKSLGANLLVLGEAFRKPTHYLTTEHLDKAWHLL